MKNKFQILGAVTAFAIAALAAQAQTAGVYDLVIGVKQTGATNDVMIDFGDVRNLTTGTLGNYSSILQSNFGGTGWSTSSSVSWGAVAVNSPADDSATSLFATAKWTSTTGSLGVQNSTQADKSHSTLGTANTKVGNVYTGIDTYTAGAAETILASNNSSWTKNAPFNLATNFNNTFAPANVTSGGFSASDLYLIGDTNPGNGDPGTHTQFLGTLAFFQDGTITFTAIPEPSTYAALLSVVTLGVVAIRRRRQAALEV